MSTCCLARSHVSHVRSPHEIIRDLCLRSSTCFPDVLLVDHDPKLTSEVFWAFAKGMRYCLIVSSAYNKNINAKVKQANSLIGDTIRAYARGSKDAVCDGSCPLPS
jgi:hypothetical protein